jgi:hypothetical protein
MKLPPKGRPYLFVAMWKIQQAVVEKLLRDLGESEDFTISIFLLVFIEVWK